MREPIRIISDLHLSHPVSRISKVSALRPLIAGAGTMIFNGDTWQELALPFHQRSREMLAELQSLCRSEGADAVFLPGNHDPGWSGQGWLELCQGRVIVTHGDTLMRAGSPWKREILTSPATVDEIWSRYPMAKQDPRQRHQLAREIARRLCSVEYPPGRRLWQRAIDAANPPNRALWMLAAWFTQAQMVSCYRDSYFPNARYFVIGHFHRRGRWTKHGIQTLNTGCFVNPGRAACVELAGATISYAPIIELKHEIHREAASFHQSVDIQH